MGDVTYIQSLQIIAGKTPSSQGGRISERDFAIDPAETLEITDLNEDSSHRFAVPSGSVDISLCNGTLDLIKLLVIRSETNLDIKIVNANGTSQNIQLFANRTSILHAEITDVLVTNNTGSPIKGIYFVAGD